jgi:cytochrome c5
VHSETAKTRLFLIALLNLGLLLVGSNASAQQSIEDNVRPVGQVCLAGQSCVGSTVGTAPAAAPSAVAPVAAAVEEVVEVVEEVVEAVAEVAAFDVESTYQMSCFACHGTGAAGAPVMGDADAWSERMGKGMEAVMANVVNGVNAMPPKGLCMTCSDDNLLELVNYMAGQ